MLPENFSHWRELQNFDLNVFCPTRDTVRLAVARRSVKRGEYLREPASSGGQAIALAGGVFEGVVCQTALREMRERLGCPDPGAV